MVIDTSALLCVLLNEMEAPRFARALDREPRCVIAAPTWAEAAQVITARLGPAGYAHLTHLLDRVQVETVAFDLALAKIAYEAWLRFGKGRHPAGLNFGDCFSYALAKQRGEPLLFKGEDFSRTDIVPAA